MNQDKFLAILFYTFLILFVITAGVELCALVGWVPIPHEYEKALFSAVIVQVAGSIFALWKQLSGGKFVTPPEVNGEWDYVCIREDGSYKHGGVCKLFVNRGPLGWEFDVQGTRTWTANFSNSQWMREDLPAPYGWNSSWGTFTGNDSLRFEYSIKAEGGVILGYGWMSVEKRNAGKPSQLSGNFFQLPPYEPFYGSLEFRRIALPEPTN